jgi:hypothetical protein
VTSTCFDSYSCGSDKAWVGPVEWVGAEGDSRLSPFADFELVGLSFYSLRITDMLDLLLVEILESRPGESQKRKRQIALVQPRRRQYEAKRVEEKSSSFGFRGKSAFRRGSEHDLSSFLFQFVLGERLDLDSSFY